ncbi:MAG: hypothetical protein H0W61_17880 [Bacteroidetes bacterium]|nr:hypothetical protein [Bacteroidota bacterium]
MRSIVAIGIFFLCVTACNKKKTNTPASNTGTSIPHTNVMTLKLNGLAWQAHPEGYSISKSTVFNFSGQNNPGSPFSSVAFAFPLTTTVGVNNFGSAGTVTGKFKDSLGLYFTAKSGTLNITELDTFSYGPKKLKGTFSFVTDTVGGKTYTVSSGFVDFKL